MAPQFVVPVVPGSICWCPKRRREQLLRATLASKVDNALLRNLAINSFIWFYVYINIYIGYQIWKNGFIMFYRFISSMKMNPLFPSGSNPNQATRISKQGPILPSIVTLQRKMVGTKCRDFTGQQSSMSINSYCTLILHIRHIYALLYTMRVKPAVTADQNKGYR